MKIVFYDQIDSTNDEALRLLQAGQNPPFAIAAKQQSAGRGRHGRVWQSEPGNLFFTYVLRPNSPITSWPQLSFVMALAVTNAIRHFIPSPKIEYKWPNDLLWEGRKICGILLETAQDQMGESVLIVGIGVNLLHAPMGTSYPAASVLALSGKTVAAASFADQLCKIIPTWINGWQQNGFEAYRMEWLAHAAHLRQKITISDQKSDDGQPLQGLFLDLREDGALLLQTDSGAIKPILSGIIC